MRIRLRAGAAALALLAACAGGRAALAAEPPFGKAEVSMTAREQPIGVFLQDFFRQAGLTAVVSPDLTGSINGSFTGPAGRVYEGLARAFNLLTYYDGVAVYVYPAAQISTETVPAPPGGGARLEQVVRQLGMTDAQDRVQVSNGSLVATGSRRFLDQVAEVGRRQSGIGGTPPGYGMGGAVAAGGVVPAPLEYRVYYLRYGWAEDVTMTFSGRQVTLPGVASILRALMVGDAPAVKRIESVTAPAYGSGLAPTPASFAAAAAAGAPGVTRGSDTLGFNLAAYGQMPPPDAAAAWSRIAGAPPGAAFPPPAFAAATDEPRVIADNRLNAVIIRDTRQHLDAYDQLIRALDVEPQLVEIESTIIDIDTDKVRQLGAGFSIADLTGNQAFTLGAGDGGFVGPPAGGGVFTAAFTAGDVHFRAGLQALVSKGAAQVVAQPELLTLSDVEAVFDNSKTFYVRVSGVQAADLYNITAGTTLRVTPHVTRDQGQTRIRMLIAIQDGSLSGQSVDRIPVVSNSGINTQALLLEGQSLLLGGLVTQTDKRAVDKVPVLGDTPLLGFLFRNSVKESAHTERLFLLTPRLVSIGASNAPPATSALPSQYAPRPGDPHVSAPPPAPPSPVPEATVRPSRPAPPAR